MVKVCVISPSSHLSCYSTLGDCEMALTHLVVDEDGKLNQSNEWSGRCYIPYYQQKSKEGKWIILDNSAYEIGKLEARKAEGQGLGPKLVIEAARIINPSIVIAQDVLCDREKTLESTKRFIKYVQKEGLQGKFQIMAVAQGKTKDEWLSSYEDLIKIPEVDQIGFSKISVPLSFGENQTDSGCVAHARLKATEEVNRQFYQVSNNSSKLPTAHLLGGDNKLPWELQQQAKYSWIFSNDSSASVWYGAHQQEFNPNTGFSNYIITNKPDLENKNTETICLLNENQISILKNIAILHRFSKG